MPQSNLLRRMRTYEGYSFKLEVLDVVVVAKTDWVWPVDLLLETLLGE